MGSPVAPVELTSEERYLRQQLEAARNADLTLDAENTLLRTELEKWRAAGSSVAQREAKVVDAIKDRQLEGEVAAATKPEEDSIDFSFLATSVKNYMFNSGKQPLDDRTNFWRVAVLVGLINAVAFLGWRASEPLQSAMLKASSHLPYVNPMLRRAGIGHYVVEISEMQVSNLKVDGDIYIVLQAGGQEQRTNAQELADGRLLRFEESLRVSLKSNDEGSCVFHVVDRDNPLAEKRLARLEIPAQEVLSLACRNHGEYCNFELFPGAAPRPSMWGGAAVRPTLGLRLRDVSLPSKASKGGAKQRRKASAEPPEGGPLGYATFGPPRSRAGTMAAMGSRHGWRDDTFPDA